MSYDIYAGILKMNDAFDCGREITLNYDFNHPALQRLREKYHTDVIAGDGDDFSKSLHLLHWVSRHMMHSGNSKANASNILDLMTYSYDKGPDFGINCAMLSHVLSGCLMSVGIYAREIKLIPCSPYDFDSHRIVHAYIKEKGKWIMLDPTYSGYVMNKDGDCLNMLEIRNLMSNQEYIVFNKELNYNGQSLDKDSLFYKEYLAKNAFCLCTPAFMSFDSIQFDGFAYLCPRHFDIKQRDLYSLEYKTNKTGYDLTNYIQAVKNDHYDRLSPEIVLKCPL